MADMSQQSTPRQLPPRMTNPSAAVEFAALTARALAINTTLSPQCQNQDGDQTPRPAKQVCSHPPLSDAMRGKLTETASDDQG